MRTVVKKWGNSASIRIPVGVMEAAHLKVDQEVDVREEDGRIVVEPVHRVSFDLADLLDRITDENVHGEISTGDAVGQEAW